MWSSGDKIKKDEMVGVCRIYGRLKTCNMNRNRRITPAKQLCIQRDFISWKRRKTRRNDKKEWQRAENLNLIYMALYLGATLVDYVMKTEYDDWN